MTGSVWRVEWTTALRRRRLFALNMAIPLLLVAPLTLGGAPVFHAAAALSVLFVLFGTFGSAIPILREGEGGALRRILLTGASPARVLSERVAAGAALDLLQLVPSLALVLVAWRAPAGAWLLGLPVLALSLLAANLVGLWVAAAARSIAEGALFAAVTALFLLHGSGVFRTAAPGSAAALVESVLPFAPLHRLVLAAGGAVPLPPAAWALALPALGALALLGATLPAARVLFERVAPATR